MKSEGIFDIYFAGSARDRRSEIATGNCGHLEEEIEGKREVRG